MPRISDLSGRPVLGSKGKRRGKVLDVLFHPSEARTVGYVIKPSNILYVVERRPRYVAFEALSFDDEGNGVLSSVGIPSARAGEKAMGLKWEESSYWRGIAVRAEDGDRIGAVQDVIISLKTGAVRGLCVSTGVVGDVAVGRLEVPEDYIIGPKGDAVVLRAGYEELESTGGLAAATGKGAAAAKVHGERAAKKAYDTGVSAAVKVGRSFKQGTGRKMVDTLKKWTADKDEE
ncbi:MAG: PRC-barrel domain-containing protein [Coriobacteriia bacterium]|nr:PRC-barrel domain-containing protein [Coriobacteriia bacterium]